MIGAVFLRSFPPRNCFLFHSLALLSFVEADLCDEKQQVEHYLPIQLHSDPNLVQYGYHQPHIPSPFLVPSLSAIRNEWYITERIVSTVNDRSFVQYLAFISIDSTSSTKQNVLVPTSPFSTRTSGFATSEYSCASYLLKQYFPAQVSK